MRGEGDPGLSVTINGETVTVAAGTTLGAWLESAGFDARTVAVEHNRAIVPRAAYGATAIEDGDRLEIVRFVQGG